MNDTLYFFVFSLISCFLILSIYFNYSQNLEIKRLKEFVPKSIKHNVLTPYSIEYKKHEILNGYFVTVIKNTNPKEYLRCQLVIND